MKWLVRTGGALLVFILLLVGGVAALVFIDTMFGKQAQDYANRTYQAADGTTLYAYLAKPNSPAPHPAVVMIHEFYGLNESIVKMADKLAAQGYVVIAPDTYRNQTTAQIPRAILLRVTVPEERVMQDIQSAFDFLKTQREVDAQRIAILGFCYGGEMALQHALRNSELAATVVLYGNPVTDVDGLGVLRETKRPVLGIFAEQDQQIPPAQARAFQNALNAADIPNLVTIYPSVGHAFVQPESIAAGGAARAAWEQILQFLDVHVKQKSARAVEFPSARQTTLSVQDFRARSLATNAKFDVAFLCTVVLSHWRHTE